jgi:hypothetical protein
MAAAARPPARATIKSEGASAVPEIVVAVCAGGCVVLFVAVPPPPPPQLLKASMRHILINIRENLSIQASFYQDNIIVFGLSEVSIHGCQDSVW